MGCRPSESEVKTNPDGHRWTMGTPLTFTLGLPMISHPGEIPKWGMLRVSGRIATKDSNR